MALAHGDDDAADDDNHDDIYDHDGSTLSSIGVHWFCEVTDVSE